MHLARILGSLEKLFDCSPLEPATQNLAFHKVNIPPPGLCYTQRVLITAMTLLAPALMLCAKGYSGS